MEYNLKDKIEVTEEFLNDLIAKNWQEVEALQQQIANIDTSSKLGAYVAKLLKNTCTNYYVLIGCLETLIENPEAELEVHEQETKPEAINDITTADPTVDNVIEPEALQVTTIKTNADFEPFEYFVDFDEPSGAPISDQDLYG
jgi:hypothetical protein